MMRAAVISSIADSAVAFSNKRPALHMPIGRGNVLCPAIPSLALNSRPAAAVAGVAGAMAAAKAWRDGRGTWTSTG
eukprot:260000-Chlamydomonas_euryale.AAC.1